MFLRFAWSTPTQLSDLVGSCSNLDVPAELGRSHLLRWLGGESCWCQLVAPGGELGGCLVPRTAVTGGWPVVRWVVFFLSLWWMEEEGMGQEIWSRQVQGASYKACLCAWNEWALWKVHICAAVSFGFQNVLKVNTSKRSGFDLIDTETGFCIIMELMVFMRSTMFVNSCHHM